jgi:antitoxin ParD1/3/4
MTTVTISLPQALRKFVHRQVKTKGYGNVSEYFRGLLREAESREAEERLEALLLEGLESGDGIELDRKFWKELKTEVARLIEKHRKRA